MNKAAIADRAATTMSINLHFPPEVTDGDPIRDSRNGHHWPTIGGAVSLSLDNDL
jgi:hypothetical protein